MGNCYSTYHIVEDYIHTGIICNIEYHNRSAALERSVIDNWYSVGGGGRAYTCFTGSEPSPVASAVVRNIKSA